MLPDSTPNPATVRSGIKKPSKRYLEKECQKKASEQRSPKLNLSSHSSPKQGVPQMIPPNKREPSKKQQNKYHPKESTKQRYKKPSFDKWHQW
jgi:hypothetical protein